MIDGGILGEERGLGANVEWLASHGGREVSSVKTETLVIGAEMAGYRIVSGRASQACCRVEEGVKELKVLERVFLLISLCCIRKIVDLTRGFLGKIQRDLGSRWL